MCECECECGRVFVYVCGYARTCVYRVCMRACMYVRGNSPHVRARVCVHVCTVLAPLHIIRGSIDTAQDTTAD